MKLAERERLPRTELFDRAGLDVRMEFERESASEVEREDRACLGDSSPQVLFHSSPSQTGSKHREFFLEIMCISVLTSDKDSSTRSRMSPANMHSGRTSKSSSSPQTELRDTVLETDRQTPDELIVWCPARKWRPSLETERMLCKGMFGCFGSRQDFFLFVGEVDWTRAMEFFFLSQFWSVQTGMSISVSCHRVNLLQCTLYWHSNPS